MKKKVLLFILFIVINSVSEAQDNRLCHSRIEEVGSNSYLIKTISSEKDTSILVYNQADSLRLLNSNYDWDRLQNFPRSRILHLDDYYRIIYDIFYTKIKSHLHDMDKFDSFIYFNLYFDMNGRLKEIVSNFQSCYSRFISIEDIDKLNTEFKKSNVTLEFDREHPGFINARWMHRLATFRIKKFIECHEKYEKGVMQ